MLVTRALVERLESVEVETVSRLVRSLAPAAADPVPEWSPWGGGLLVAMGPRRYVNRAVGVTLDELSPGAVSTICSWFSDRGVPPAVQLSSWAGRSTVDALTGAGFGPAWCRSVLALDLSGPAPGPPDAGATVDDVEVLVVDDDDRAAAASAVMSDDQDDPSTTAEFMAADRGSRGTTQLLARVAGQVVGCGSLTVVGTTAWLGAAGTLPRARGRGVQTALLRHRLHMARAAGCDLVGVTASVGSTSVRNLQRVGFGLVQEQWVLQRGR